MAEPPGLFEGKLGDGKVTHRLMIFSPTGGCLSLLGGPSLHDVYSTWMQTNFDPPDSKFEVVGFEDEGRRTPIRIALLWEDVKGMQLETLTGR